MQFKAELAEESVRKAKKPRRGMRTLLTEAAQSDRGKEFDPGKNLRNLSKCVQSWT